MEAKIFKSDNYITVQGFAVVEHKLSGNELLCYSLIYGFTQDGETEFFGSLTYIASALNITRQNAKKVIERLIDRGLVTKKDIYFSGVKFCHYMANRYSNGVAEIATGLTDGDSGVAESATGGVAEIATHNISNKDIEIIDNASAACRTRKTSEALCTFANSRYADFDEFAKCFDGEQYRSIDIAYYYHAVADWSAQRAKKKNDWIATARNFMRSDKQDGHLHTKTESDPYMQELMHNIEMGRR